MVLDEQLTHQVGGIPRSVGFEVSAYEMNVPF